MQRREFCQSVVAAAIAVTAPALPIATKPEIKCFLMGDCDYIAAESKEQARQWYRDVWCGVDYELHDITEVSDQEQFTIEDDDKTYTFAEEIADNIALGGKFPIYLATDGHYC